jgi:pyrroloquinoline-quinone synthase
MSKSGFRLALEAAVDERHCADHPIWDMLAAGDLGKNACMGWAVEHYHWISNMLTEATFQICSKAPADVIELEIANFHEEEDPDDPDRDGIPVPQAIQPGVAVAA